MNSNFLSVLGLKFFEEGVSKDLMRSLSVEEFSSVDEILRSAIIGNKGGPVSKRAQILSENTKRIDKK
jgi:hypothetical protein